MSAPWPLQGPPDADHADTVRSSEDLAMVVVELENHR
jgi:hypothetical protein